MRKIAITAGLQALFLYKGAKGDSTTTVLVLPKRNAALKDAVPLSNIGKVDPIEETVNQQKPYKDPKGPNTYSQIMKTTLPAPTPGADYSISIAEDIAALETYLNDSSINLAEVQPALFYLFNKIDKAYFETSIGGVVAEGLKSENFPVDYTTDLISIVDIQKVVSDLQDRLNVVEQRESKELGTEDRITEETASGVSARIEPKSPLLAKLLQGVKNIYSFKNNPIVFTPKELEDLVRQTEKTKRTKKPEDINEGISSLLNPKRLSTQVRDKFLNDLQKQLKALKTSKSLQGFSISLTENVF